MAIQYINNANTFQQWLVATQSLITVANNLTDGGETKTFHANTNFNVANNVTIGGDLTVSGNVTLDIAGFDNLIVSGDTTMAGTLGVTGATTMTTATITTATITNAAVTTFTGTANTNIYTAISLAGGDSLAFAIALG
jgi:hypothetical protein